MGVAHTYSHLARAGRMPSVYEVVSSELLYHRALGVAVENPVTAFLARHGSRLVEPPLGAFSDPRATTYASYVELERRRETFVSELFSQLTVEADRALPEAWVALLERVFAPLRYPCHGLALFTSYLGSTASDSRRVIALAFAAADETRRVHRFAERLFLLRRAHPGLGDDARSRFETDSAFQPLREHLERTLATYDVGEALLAGEIGLVPALDDFVCVALASAAERHGDVILHRLLTSLADDAAWHESASEAWLDCLAAVPENRAFISERIEPELARAERALEPLVELVGAENEFHRARGRRRERLLRFGAQAG